MNPVASEPTIKKAPYQTPDHLISQLPDYPITRYPDHPIPFFAIFNGILLSNPIASNEAIFVPIID
jgi:hypothetical protein